MLSLVNYGSSDESEEDECNVEEKPGKSSLKNAISSKESFSNAVEDISQRSSESTTLVVKKDSISDEEDAGLTNITDVEPTNNRYEGTDAPLLSALPKPAAKVVDVSWDQLSKLTYKTGAVRILAPPILEESNEDKKREKKLPSQGGSGLLAVLPKPKNDFTKKNLVPHSVSKPKSLPPAKLKTSIKQPAKKHHLTDSENEDDESESSGDFFSLSSKDDDKISDIPPIDIEFPSANNLPSTESSNVFHTEESATTNNMIEPHSVSQGVESSFQDYLEFAPNQELELDENALMQLCGARGLKRRASEMKMIDVDGSQLIPNAQEMLTKNLTQALPKPKSKGYGVTSQQKRKHQITYLAHQAKEQELELQNTWANNRMTKKQTQAKYGF